MERAMKKIMVSCVITISCVLYATQEPLKLVPQEPERNAVHSAQELVEQSSGKLGLAESGETVYLTVGGFIDFQREMEEAIVGDLVQEHEKELKEQQERNQARLKTLRRELEAEQKSEQEILAALKIEQEKLDTEMEALVKKHGEAQHAKMAEFLLGGLGHGRDQDWRPLELTQEDDGQACEVSGSDDEEDWDRLFAAAALDAEKEGEL